MLCLGQMSTMSGVGFGTLGDMIATGTATALSPTPLHCAYSTRPHLKYQGKGE